MGVSFPYVSFVPSIRSVRLRQKIHFSKVVVTYLARTLVVKKS